MHQYTSSICPHCFPSPNKRTTIQSEDELLAEQAKVNAIIRDAEFQKEEPFRFVGDKDIDASLCPLGDECSQCHTSYEYFYHWENYKRCKCMLREHYTWYPMHIQREMLAGADEGPRVTVSREKALTLQQCPFYHSAAEEQAWGAWRSAFLTFDAALSTSDEVDACSRSLRRHKWFVRFTEAVRQRKALVAEEVKRLASGEILAVLLPPYDLLQIANDIEAPCTHAALCFLQFTEMCFSPSELQLQFAPGDTTSAEVHIPLKYLWDEAEVVRSITGATSVDDMKQQGKLFVRDPLTSASVQWFLPMEHQLAIAEWLLQVSNTAAGKDQVLNTIGFFPYCCYDPFAHDIPHHYYRYLAAVVKLLKCGWSPSSAAVTTEREAYVTTGQVVYLKDDSTGRIVTAGKAGRDSANVPPLSFLTALSEGVLLCIAHWIVCGEKWIRKRSLQSEAVKAFMQAGVVAPSV